MVEQNQSRTKVLFYTFRGLIDNFSGFVYSSDDQFYSGDFNSEYIQVIKMGPNWFFVSAT